MTIDGKLLERIFADLCPHARNVRVVVNGRGVMLAATYEDNLRTYFARGFRDQDQVDRAVRDWAAKFNEKHPRFSHGNRRAS